jgi:phosphate transport system substrate-binding protein
MTGASVREGAAMRALRIVGLGVLLAVASLAPARSQDVMGISAITGAGSTFAYPVIAKWSAAYGRWQGGAGGFATSGGGLDDPPTKPALDYEPTGSLAGMLRVKDGAVDFGASDAPLPSEELRKLGLVQFPIVIGGVVAAFNIEGVGAGAIKLSGPLLADIYLGKIETWSDPAIKALNPSLKLPDARIVVVRRADGSGTTFNFTDYLSKVSPQWREKVGSDTVVKWPTGTAAKGSEGVAQAVRQTRNAIGYVEYANAARLKLGYALIQNRAGKFVLPDIRSFQAAASGAAWDPAKDFNQLLTDAPGDEAYPVTATTFILMRKQMSAARQRAALGFFQWTLDMGANDAAALGYVPLPASLVEQVKGHWSSGFKAGS